MITLRWYSKQAHTNAPVECKPREKSRLTTAVPLWAFNMMWWQGVICRTCVPEPVLSLAHAEKVNWPWWNPETVVPYGV